MRKISKKVSIAEKVLNNLTYGKDLDFHYTPLNPYFAYVTYKKNGKLMSVTGNNVWQPEWVISSDAEEDRLPSKEEFQQHFPHLVEKGDELLDADRRLREAFLAFEEARKAIYSDLIPLVNPKKAKLPYELLSQEEEIETLLEEKQKDLNTKRKRV